MFLQNHNVDPCSPTLRRCSSSRPFFSYSTTRRDLERHFSKYGDIEKVDLITDNQGRSRGFGFINFFSVDVSLRRSAFSGLPDCKHFQTKKSQFG
jgi:RNA recognition motif-containing protein